MFNKLLIASCILAIAACQKQIPAYESAVVGDVLNIGKVSELLGTEQTFSASDCKASIDLSKDFQTDAKLKIHDTDPNEPEPKSGAKPKIPTFLLLETGTKSGTFSYELICRDVKGIGLLTIQDKGSLKVDDSARIHLELSPENASKTAYYLLQGIQGDNIQTSIESKSDLGYFNEFIGKFRYFKFYQKNEAGVVERIFPKNFHKILPIRELNYRKANGLIDNKDLAIGIAVVHKDGLQVSFFDLESDKDLGRIYVHIGDKSIDVQKSYELKHCFPVLNKGVLLRYFCNYESSKEGDAIMYYDLSSTNEKLEPFYFKDAKSILAAKPMADGRTCLLVDSADKSRNVICMDASKGFNKTSENQDSYYKGESIVLDRGENCMLNFSKIDPNDFRFDEAALFQCDGGQAFASFVISSSEKAETRSFMMLSKDITPLCADDREIAYLTESNKTLVLQGGFNSPGQMIRHPLGIETTSISKIHCAQDSILILLDSKKKTYLLDIRRCDRHSSVTRVATFMDLPDRQTHMKVANSHTAVLYSVNKYGDLVDIAEYNSYLGLIKLINHNYADPKSHEAVLIFKNEKGEKQVRIQTDVVAENVISVEIVKIMKELTPGKKYDLREYFKINGQVYNIEVIAPHPSSRNVYWLPDKINFEDSKNDTASAARFVIDGMFINTADRTITKDDGKELKLTGDLLNPSRYMGTLKLNHSLAIIGKQDADIAYVQGWFVDRKGDVQSTEITKLGWSTGARFLQGVRQHSADGIEYALFYYKDNKGIGLEVEYDKESETYKFRNPEKPKEVDWTLENQLSRYELKEVKPADSHQLSSCAHFTLAGGEIPAEWTYAVCNVTGGSSNRISIRNISAVTSGEVTFDLFNYPSKESGLSMVSWWQVKSNLIDEHGDAVHPAQFEYSLQLLRRFNGLKGHEILKVFTIDESTVVITQIEEGDKKGLYEVYYGSAGDRPVIVQRFSKEIDQPDMHKIEFMKVGGKLKRVFSRYDRDLNNMANVIFKGATLRLSNHTATVQVQNPFDLKFNGQFNLKSVFLYLDKYYRDDGKTDEDDNPKPKPEPEPPAPEEGTRRSRLWYVAGILLLIAIVGSLDLYLRKRSNAEKDESESSKPLVERQKKSMIDVPNNDNSSSVHEL